MRSHIIRTFGFAAAALLVATSAQAQGKGNGKGKATAQAAKARAEEARRDDRDDDRREARRDDRDKERRDARGEDRDRERRDARRDDEIRRADGVLIPRDNRDIRGNGRKVPPGLAKKPGQMPPGQYKKRYGTNDGATVLGDIMRRRGYDVQRIVASGDSRYVYYRTPDGLDRRAIVSPGTDRLVFRNVPQTLLQEVLARLY